MIEVLLKSQESCVISGGTVTEYFKLEIGTRQRDPKSVYLFILVLEIFLLKIQENKIMKGLNIFNHTWLHAAYEDDATLFLIEKNLK